MAYKYMELSDNNFEKHIKSPLSLVDFWGEGCVPCKMMEPILDSIFDKYGSKIMVFRADIAECSKSAVRYGVRSIPTLVLFRGGKLAERFPGVTRGSVVGAKIEGLLETASS